jgi:hypothetical protein
MIIDSVAAHDAACRSSSLQAPDRAFSSVDDRYTIPNRRAFSINMLRTDRLSGHVRG